ncbi:hypothetical protein LTR64_008427 [Lithohypha guttulata]|uniref:uncharacterized protein n=1 Tax=Lithohypha guttulata TaxID=1690604 RepID=UPI002DDE6AA2|nr:hypothetical protein LTR51_008528 [Lithohypha guttulata]
MTNFYARQDAAGSADASSDAWAGFELWHYKPSMAAAVIFIVLFVLLSAYHSFLLIRRRTWFCVPFVVGGLFEIIGYIGRALAVNNIDSVPPYTIQALGLLLAPILFAASIYMILGRIVRVLQGEAYTIIRVNWLTKIFVTGDVLCFCIQAAGGGMLAVATTQAEIDRDNNIVLGGLILQVCIFIVFLVTAIIFHRRMSQRPTSASLDGSLGENGGISSGRFGTMTWRKLMVGLYVSSILISLRNIFRVVEYAMGWSGYLLSTEWPLYVFDGLLMVLVLVVCIMWYHPEISKGNKKSAAAMRKQETSGPQTATV